MIRYVVPLAVVGALFALPGAASAQTYAPVGVQSNVPVATVTGGGWTECHRETFASHNVNSIASISTACASSQMMMACRPVGSPTLTLLAQAPKVDVMFDTGTGNVTHDVNGVAWYFNNSWSWGFTAVGNAVSRNSCDTNAGADRMCVHTGGGNTQSGYRCGTNFLNGDPTWERVFYTATPVPPIPTTSFWSLVLLGLSLAIGAFVVMRQRIFGA